MLNTKKNINSPVIFKKTLIAMGLVIASFSCCAGFFDTHAQGWHWYETLEEKTKEPETKESSSLSPLELLENIKKEIDGARAKAVIEPTEKNVYEYIKVQEHWANQAERFANVWQQVIIHHPELNYGLANPTSELAKRIKHQEQTQKIKDAIKYTGQNYGIFYFYNSNCPYCKNFSPILKNFGDKYKIAILPISLDGKPTTAFRTFKINNGIAQKWQVNQVPALYAVSPKQDEVIPIAFGLISQSELEQRFALLARYVQEKKHAPKNVPSYRQP